MFNVGGGELLVILFVALVVLGPDKLPDAARKIGNVMGEIRRMSAGFQEEVRAAMDQPHQAVQSIKDTVTQPGSNTGADSVPSADAAETATEPTTSPTPLPSPADDDILPVDPAGDGHAARTDDPAA